MKYGHVVIDRSIPAMQAWKKIPEGILAEVINGKLYVSPSPTPYHQDISLTIKVELFSYVLKNRLGKVYDAPTDLHLAEDLVVVIPDIIFIANENKLIIDRQGLHGAPDLLIEILSPGTRRRDLTIKKSLYEQSGVKEYWLVDPDTKNSQGYILENGSYRDPLLMNSEIYIRILKKVIPF